MKQFVLFFLSFSCLFLVSCGEDNDSDAFEEQLAFDLLAIDTYLDENNIEAQIHSSGIRYIEVVTGEGNSPAESDSVTVIYTVTLFDGSVVDESEEGIQFLLSELIEAWKIMIPEMKTGGELTMYAPSGYCYGTQSVGSIPPNSNIIFDISLLEVN